MALKDLVADQRKVTEEAIEKIVTGWIKYDPNAKAIIFTPDGGALPNERKLLVYLTAVLGWQYVLDEPVEVSTKPADLEAATGIHGGTLRPTLKKLKDTHLIASDNGHYKVQAANLDSVGKVVAGEKAPAARRSSSKPKGQQKPPESGGEPSENKKKKKGSASDVTTTLHKFIEQGFFDEPKTLAELVERYHEVGTIVKMTGVSGRALEAVQKGLLTRSKSDVNGRSVWTYKTAGK